MTHLEIDTNSRIHNTLLLIIGSILLSTGFYLSSINFMGVEWFSRSGSLVVILGVGSSFTGIIQERILLGRLEIKRRIEVSRTKRKLRNIKADAEYAKKELDNIENTFEQHATYLAQAIKFSFGLMEGVLLIIGTFIWGFGDLIH